MTWEELTNQARVLLQDLDSDRYRFSDENLIAACHLACTTAKQIRPDLFYGQILFEGEHSPCFPGPPYDDATLAKAKAATVPVSESYHQPFIWFVAGYAEIINEEFTGADRSAALLNGFRTQLLRGATA